MIINYLDYQECLYIEMVHTLYVPLFIIYDDIYNLHPHIKFKKVHMCTSYHRKHNNSMTKI